MTRIHDDKWRDFGIALRIPSSTLDEYEREQRTPRRCYEAVFQEWEKRSHPPRWETILQALQTDIVDERHLANALSERLCPS